MEEQQKINNPQVRDFAYEFVAEKIKSIPFFEKVYGKGFVEERIRAFVYGVYTNEVNHGPKDIGGYYTIENNTITICKEGKDGQLLTPEDILNDPELISIIVHEFIHAVLKKSPQECKEFGITKGTGMFMIYTDPQTGKKSEIGRGLNEGLTEWMVEKTGCESKAYPMFKKMIKLLEVSIGTERTLALGTGMLSQNLGMPREMVNRLLGYSDTVLIQKDNVDVCQFIANVLRENHENGEEKEKYEKVLPTIEKIKSNPAYKKWLEKNHKEESDSSLIEFIETDYIKGFEKQRDVALIKFESAILDRFFTNSLEQIFESEVISEENYKKCKEIVSLLSTNIETVPDIIKDIEPEMSAIRVKKEFEKLTERFLQQLAKEQAQKYKEGVFSIHEFVEKMTSLLGDRYWEQDNFMELLLENMPQEARQQMRFVLRCAIIKKDNPEYLKDLSNVTAYKITCKRDDEEVSVIAIKNGNKMLDKYCEEIVVDNENKDEEFEFEFTWEMPDEGTTAIKNFEKLRDEVLAKNPNASIHISSRTISIQDGDNISFYYIHQGQFIPMEIEEQNELNLNGQKTEELQPAKVNSITKILNFFRTKIYELRNRGSKDRQATVTNNDGAPGQIVFNDLEPKREKKISQYRVDQQPERIMPQEDIRRGANVTKKEEDEHCQ